jgi:hypothetical protein
MGLKNVFENITNERFEQKVKILQANFLKNGFKKGNFQAQSKNLGLGGFQLQAEFPNNFRRVFEFIENITNWQIPDHQIHTGIMKSVTGTRSGDKDAVIIENNLDNFLTQNNVFSYAFTKMRKINYTCFKP